jgi:hypothetical protein
MIDQSYNRLWHKSLLAIDVRHRQHSFDLALLLHRCVTRRLDVAQVESAQAWSRGDDLVQWSKESVEIHHC